MVVAAGGWTGFRPDEVAGIVPMNGPPEKLLFVLFNKSARRYGQHNTWRSRAGGQQQQIGAATDGTGSDMPVRLAMLGVGTGSIQAPGPNH